MNEKPEIIRQILAKNIKKRREMMGLTQEQLAESANLSLRSVNDIEGCRMWVSDKSITRIAKALNIDVFELFVPYQAHKRELAESPAAILAELRRTIMSDVEKMNTQLNANIDTRFNNAFKNPMHQRTEPELGSRTPDRDRPRRGR